MGWVFLSSYLLITIFSAFISDPDLLAERSRRDRKDQKDWDRLLLGLYGPIVPMIVPLIAGLDLRYGWQPEISITCQLLALAVYILGWGVHLWAMAVNKYFALFVRIQKDRGQTVATSGPYRYVRHPGYVGGILLTASAALVLGSWWAFIPGVLGALMLIIRTVLEDRTLQEELEEYKEYAQQVRYRLLPGIW